MHAWIPVAAIVCISLAPLAANAQAPAPRDDKTVPAAETKPAKPAKLAPADRRFLLQAGRSGVAEVEAGRLAAQKATNPAVKQFAQHMVDEHGKANEELKRLASAKGVAVPSTLHPTDKATMKRLQQASGNRFDEIYVKEQRVAHQTAVTLFQQVAKNGIDPDVKAFAQNGLPSLQKHLQMVSAIDVAPVAAGGEKPADKPSGPMPAATPRP